MALAAEMEDNTEKAPVTPGEIIPASELLADLLMQLNRYDKALEAYEADLKKHPNRFNGLFGAGLAAEKSNNYGKAKAYYSQFVKTTVEDPNRIEFRTARYFLVKAN